MEKSNLIHDITLTIIRNTAKIDLLQSKVTELFVTIDDIQNISGIKKFFFVYFLPQKLSKYWILYNYNIKLVRNYMKQYQVLMRRNNKYTNWIIKLEGNKNV